jgi:predicted transposase/invertase (TIGR01784 family)
MSNTDKKGQTFNHDTIEAMNETKDIKPSKYNSFNDVEELMADTNDIKDAVIEVHERSKDEQLRRLAELKEKAIMDEKAIYKAGKLRGEKEGISQGELKKSIEIIKNLYSMNLPISQIAQAVDMSETEVKKIIDENQ